MSWQRENINEKSDPSKHGNKSIFLLFNIAFKILIITNNVCTWMQNKITQQWSNFTECIPVMLKHNNLFNLAVSFINTQLTNCTEWVTEQGQN